MKKTKIIIDRAPLSAEEIAQHRNFAAVLQGAQTQNRPVYRSNWFIANSIILVVGAGIWLGLANMDKGNNAEKPFVNPPFPAQQKAMTVYLVATDQPQELQYATGSKIIIPANAFVLQDGTPATGTVEIRYREYHDQADIFLSGIPMEYDSAGTGYMLESAGMMEIRAYQAGTEVCLAPDKKIEIQMASRVAGTEYNLYELDTAAKNWAFRGKDSIVGSQETVQISESSPSSEAEPKEIAVVSQKLAEVKKEIAQIEKKAPIKPEAVTDKNWNFKIKVDPKEFPELSAFDNIVWEVDESSKPFNPNHAKIMWGDVTVNKIEGSKLYEVVFIRLKQVIRYRAKPVFEGADLVKAKKMYDANYKEYSQKLAERREREARYAADLAQKRAEWERQRAEAEKRQRDYEEANRVNNAVNRVFAINNFGYWNCDHPVTYPRVAKSDMELKNSNGDNLIITKFVVVNRYRNSMISSYTIYSTSGTRAEVEYEKRKDNMIWAVTEDKKLAILNFEDFKNSVEDAPDKSDVAMTIIEDDSKIESTIREMLQKE